MPIGSDGLYITGISNFSFKIFAGSSPHLENTIDADAFFAFTKSATPPSVPKNTLDFIPKPVRILCNSFRFPCQ